MADELKKTKVPSLNKLKVTKEKERKFVEPDEWYIAEFEKAETGKGQYGPWIKFEFKLLKGETTKGEPAKGMKFNRMMNLDMSINSDMYKWANVMMGRELKVDEELDLTTYYGEKFRILIKDKEQKKGGDGKRYQTVSTIKRIKKEE